MDRNPLKMMDRNNMMTMDRTYLIGTVMMTYHHNIN